MYQPNHVERRSWLQFRLRSLLLIPLLFGLTYTLSDQVFDHFLLLNAAYGALFGTIWGIGGLRVVGCGGARRAVAVAWAAMAGGMTAGILAGPAILAIAVWRSSPRFVSWLKNADWADRSVEVFSLTVTGCWIGAICAACGGGIVGTIAAYAFFRSSLLEASDDSSGALVTRMDTPTRWRLWIMPCVYPQVAKRDWTQLLLTLKIRGEHIATALSADFSKSEV